MERDCTHYREAISARTDGETSSVAASDLDAHLLTCDACSAFAAAVVDLSRQVDTHLAAQQVPDQAAQLLAAVDPPARTRQVRHARRMRLLLGAVGVLQLVLGLGALLAADNGHAHLSRDLGTWQLALGGALLYTAWRPVAAAGLLPLVSLAGLLGVIGAVVDVASSTVTVFGELSHLAPLLAVWPLYRLTRGRSGAVSAVARA